jgi:hypothetical protein
LTAFRAGVDSLRRGGAATGAPRARSAARAAFAVLQVGGWGAQLVALVGLALSQADESAGDGGIVALSVGAATISLRYVWFVWAAQLAGRGLLAAAWRGGARLAPFKAATWLVLVYSVEVNLRVCVGDLARVWRGGGALSPGLEADTQVLFGGLVAWATCAWGAVFAGSAAAWGTTRHAGDDEEAAGGGGEGEGEGEGAAPGADADGGEGKGEGGV